MLTIRLRPASGSAAIFGADITKDNRQARQNIGCATDFDFALNDCIRRK